MRRRRQAGRRQRARGTQAPPPGSSRRRAQHAKHCTRMHAACCCPCLNRHGRAQASSAAHDSTAASPGRRRASRIAPTGADLPGARARRRAPRRRRRRAARSGRTRAAAGPPPPAHTRPRPRRRARRPSTPCPRRRCPPVRRRRRPVCGPRHARPPACIAGQRTHGAARPPATRHSAAARRARQLCRSFVPCWVTQARAALFWQLRLGAPGTARKKRQTLGCSI